MNWTLVAGVAIPAGALPLLLRPRVRPEVAARIGVWATAVALAACVLVLGVAASTAADPSIELASWLAWSADPLVGALLVLVTGVSVVVQAFASRYLQADPAQRAFAACAVAITAASASMIAAATLWTLVASWTAIGIGVVVMIWRCSGEPLLGGAAQRAATSLLIGDLALWAAVIIAVSQLGTARLDELAVSGGGTAATVVVALLIVVAGAARSAQLPLQRWLSDSLVAPTPVSALLHAGVINGAGVLFIKLAPLLTASSAAMYVTFAIGATTLAYAAAAMLARPDVKGALAWSTVGQMGFMVLTCGLGAFTAAAFHLIAHSMYKASLFLGSGTAVQTRVRELHAPPMAQATARQLALPAAACGLLAGVAIAALFPVFHAEASDADAAALMVFVWVTATWLGTGWIARQMTARGYGAGVSLAGGFAAAYLALSATFAALVDAAMPGAGSAVSPWFLAPVAAVLLSIAWLRSDAAAGLRTVRPLRRLLYTVALNAGAARPSRAGTPVRVATSTTKEFA